MLLHPRFWRRFCYPKVQNLVIGNRAPQVNMSYDAVKSFEKAFSHEGHEVIENYAGGKTFKYCRKCKVEVNE